MFERFRWLILCLMVVSVTGCGNNPQPAPLRERRADGQPWTVRYASMSDDPRSLDPQRAYDQMSRRILEPTVETLLEYHPFKTAPYEVAPALLAEVPHPEPQPDGTVLYVCRLRPGIRYVDDPCFSGGKGRELVAEDATPIRERSTPLATCARPSERPRSRSRATPPSTPRPGRP